ncbi:thiamine diphosphate-binding protein [Phanerochaete sordida]|uniref:Thiamine diphosphate-binding protein n=1 Tax=Phanerochaete sordida TaxID=48140 RepID=A0A9P3LFD5_9APHY|nr:thiamine diphosphate-binding protein [Phanerochaete sordida]
MLTTASVFLDTLRKAGVTHAFVNWGNDHPAFLEELERQRVEAGETALEIVTSPNEMVALSAAQGFAQVTGVPALVIVHVDCGTQALAGAVHNVDRGRTPVLIFAGMAPFSGQGELKGSKNEWPMWPQDVPDQAAIVRQYMRHCTQIMSGKNVSKTLLRALQFAMSEPKGPVYISARREALEEELDPQAAQVTNAVDIKKWPAIYPTAVPQDAVDTITDALLSAKFPLILAGHTGRDTSTVEPLTQLADKLGIALFMAGSSAVSVPYSHPHFLGISFGGKNALLDEADVIVVLDADVPWIDAKGNAPRPGAKVFVVDPDPLKQTYGWSHVDADIICRADVGVALRQLLAAADAAAARIDTAAVAARSRALAARHEELIAGFVRAEATLRDPAVAEPPFVLGALRTAVAAHTPSHGAQTLWLNEGISNYPGVFDHIRPSVPGSMIASGGSSLGWALGAAVGTGLGAKGKHDLTVAVVGDGTFLFGVPSTAYWMARRYKTPYLTVIINNGGWASPKASLLGIYPNGLGSQAPGSRLSVGFGPDMPDYSQIAAAAGGAWGRRVSDPAEFEQVFKEAIRVVLEEKRCAVVDCIVRSIEVVS